MSKKKKVDAQKEAEKEELREHLKKQQRLRAQAKKLKRQAQARKLKKAIAASNKAASRARLAKPKKMVVIEEHGRSFMMEESEAREYQASQCKSCKALKEERDALLKENEELKNRLNKSFWAKIKAFFLRG